MLRLRLSDGGDRLAVLDRPPSLRGPSRELVEIDTESFAVGRPGELDPAAAGVPAWILVAAGGVLLAAASFYAFGRRRQRGVPQGERA